MNKPGKKKLRRAVQIFFFPSEIRVKGVGSTRNINRIPEIFIPQVRLCALEIEDNETAAGRGYI